MLKHVFYDILNLSLVGSITALVVFPLRFLFKNSVKKSVFVLLWLIVLLRLSIPVSIPSPTSVFNFINNSSIQSSTVGVVDIAPGFVRDGLYGKSILQREIPPASDAANPQIQTNSAAASSEPGVISIPSKSINAGDVVPFVWLTGILLLACFGISIFIITAKKLKISSEIETDSLDSCKAAVGVKRRIRIFQGNSVSSPFVYGILAPRIILPKDTQIIGDKPMEHILTHELVHIKRFDNLTRLLSFLVLCIHWFNPFVWLCYFLLQRDLEVSCDEKVLDILGDNSKKEYAASLYKFASRRNSFAGAGFTSLGVTSTKRRIKNIMYYKKKSLTAAIIAVCLIISVTAGWATNPVTAKATPTLATLSDTKPLSGSKITYAAEDGLYYTDMDSTKATLLVKGSGIYKPVFSSDGKVITYTQEGILYGYSFTTGKSRLLLKNIDSYTPGQNGTFYAASQKVGIVSINPQSGKSTTIIAPVKDTSFTNLALSPDTKRLAYNTAVSGIENQDKGGAWIYDTATKKTRMILRDTKMNETSMGSRSVVGKWTPDSGKLFVWRMSLSASISADGVGSAIYNVTSGKLMELDTIGLAYDENISFEDNTKFAMIIGGNREMFVGKSLSIFTFKSTKPVETLNLSGKVATTPSYSSDSKLLAFAASPSAKIDDEYSIKKATLAKRQIYMYIDSKLFGLTNDAKYRSEAPVFLKNNNYIVFSRVSRDGEYSVWVMDSDGGNQKQLARWKYKAAEDFRATDFYGRIDWSNMYDIFDNTKTAVPSKLPPLSKQLS